MLATATRSTSRRSALGTGWASANPLPRESKEQQILTTFNTFNELFCFRFQKATFQRPMDAPQDIEEVYRLLCSAQAQAAHDEDALRRLRHEITAVSGDLGARGEDVTRIARERDDLLAALPALLQRGKLTVAHACTCIHRAHESVVKALAASPSSCVSHHEQQTNQLHIRRAWQPRRQAFCNSRSRCGIFVWQNSRENRNHEQ